MPRRPSAFARAFRPGSRVPVVSYSILALTLGVFVLQWISQGAVTSALAYFPPLTSQEPWRMVTVALVHSDRSFFHIVFNMYSLWVLGPLLESLIGRGRFAAVYVLSALGGSVAVLWLAPLSVVVGASGAIFGLLGAFFVIQRRLGGRNVQLVVIIAINLALGFLIPGVSWQSHLGGLLVGALCAWIMLRTRGTHQRRQQRALIGLVAGGLILATVLRVTMF
jgi:membrane associated rhomboid family serine protease